MASQKCERFKNETKLLVALLTEQQNSTHTNSPLTTNQCLISMAVYSQRHCPVPT